MTVKELMAASKVMFSESDLNIFLDHMAQGMKKNEKIREWNPIFLCVMNGGLMFTAELMKRLDFPLEFDFCQVSRYGSSETGGELVWKREPELSLAGRIVVICDDILDEGITLNEIKAYCIARGAKVYTAVLFDKTRPRELDIEADYVGVRIEDEFIFGFGLDYNNFCRNLPYVMYKPK